MKIMLLLILSLQGHPPTRQAGEMPDMETCAENAVAVHKEAKEKLKGNGRMEVACIIVDAVDDTGT